MRSERRCRDMYRMPLYLGEGVYQFKKLSARLRNESLGSWDRHDSVRQEDRILCDSRSRSKAYTSVLYCNFIGLSMGIMAWAMWIVVPRLHVVAVRISGLNHTA